MSRYIFLAASILLVFTTNCETKQTKEKTATPSKLDLAVLSSEIESSVIDAYMELKGALIESDAEVASSMANEFSEILAQDSEMNALNDLVEQLAGSGDIEEQRVYFSSISQNLYTLIKNQENQTVTIYKQYCPMAFDNEGAFWLSKESTVINPYFGDKMLTCGRVEEVISASN